MELKVTRYAVDADGVATVTLDRPDRRNSWTARMHAEYRWIFATLEADPAVRCAVVTGAGDDFCVGADHRALSGYTGSGGGYDQGLPAEVARPGHGVRPEFDGDFVWQLGLRFPLVCAVNGACAGVALAIAAFSDVRFGVHGAKVTTATPQIAMPAEYGLSWILPRLVGLSRATDILLSGRVLRAEELGEMGFFARVLPREELAGAVADYARGLARLSPEAVTATKRQIYADALHADPAAAVATSSALIGRLMSRPDFAEGLAAFAEKRPPRFGADQ